MAHVQRFDHIGITVADLVSVTAFFVGLGLELEGTGSVEGEFVETVCGIPGAHCEIAMLRPPDGGFRLELASFLTPANLPGSPTAMANELGLRNVSFQVGDLQAAVDAVAADGYGRRRHRRVREQRAYGLRTRARRDHRVPFRADRLMRVRVTDLSPIHRLSTVKCELPGA